MGKKKQKLAQAEKLAEIAATLKKRELELTKEEKQLFQLQSKLDERERSIAALEAKVLSGVLNEQQESNAPDMLKAPRAEKEASSPPKPSAEEVVEMNGVLRSIYQDYSSSVHQISSQLSAVTAALMCSAVTCMLENRGFNAKDALLSQMQSILHDGMMEKAKAKPPEPADSPAPEPAPEKAIKPMPEPIPDLRQLHAEDDDDIFSPAKPLESKTRITEDGILRIGSVIEFQKLGEHGFRGDKTVVRIELPEGIQYIPGSFFYECRNLQEVWLPDSLLEIGAYAFYGCESLSAVHIHENSALQAIGEYAFAKCEALRSFTVPAATQTLGTSVFRYCTLLETLSIAESSGLRSLGSHLLSSCTALTGLWLPNSVTVIPTSMCYGCLKLEHVVAKGVETIEDYAFYHNKNLQSVRICGLKNIAAQAFEGCDPSLMINTMDA